jgi:mgtE-like transporter
MVKLMLQVIRGQNRLILIGLAALLISAAVSSIAGIYLGTSSELLAIIPGLMILLPPSIGMRGNISGVLASRLSSSMHLGEFEIGFSEGSILADNLGASFVLTVLIALILGFFAGIASWLIGTASTSVLDLVLISLVSGVFSGLAVMGITLLVAVLSYRNGLDLDLIAAPVVTTAGDIVTLPVLLLSALSVVAIPADLRIYISVASILLALVTVLSSRYRKGDLGHIVMERAFLLIPLSVLGILAGVVYSFDLGNLIQYAAFLILIPPFMGGLGSIGGILGSRLSTGMHMGEINPSFLPERDIVHHFIISYLYTLVLLPLLAVIAYSAAGLLGLASPGLQVMVIISLTAGLAIITLVNGVAYATASLSFRYGLDPDNFGIPVITSLIDLIGAATLVAVINLLI